jgi:hypothetical protein
MTRGIAQNLEACLAEDLAAIPQVRHVLTDRVDNTILVWIAVDDPRPEVRHKIYQQELDLLNGFPEIEFDFNVIPSQGRSVADIASGAKVVYSRQE